MPSFKKPFLLVSIYAPLLLIIAVFALVGPALSAPLTSDIRAELKHYGNYNLALPDTISSLASIVECIVVVNSDATIATGVYSTDASNNHNSDRGPDGTKSSEGSHRAHLHHIHHELPHSHNHPHAHHAAAPYSVDNGRQDGNVFQPLYPKNSLPIQLYPYSPAGLPSFVHKYAVMKKMILTRLRNKIAAHDASASMQDVRSTLAPDSC